MFGLRPIWISAMLALGSTLLVSAAATDLDLPYSATNNTLSGESNVVAKSCSEGLDKCLENCEQFNPSDWEEGGTGAWVGCRTSCRVRCESDRGGCHKGWCWAGCSTGFPFLEEVEWCYTTKGRSQDYNYVRCSSSSECNLGWKCAGPCAAF